MRPALTSDDDKWTANLRDYAFRSGALKATLEGCRELFIEVESDLRGLRRHSDLHRKIERKLANIDELLALIEQADKRVAA